MYNIFPFLSKISFYTYNNNNVISITYLYTTYFYKNSNKKIIEAQQMSEQEFKS